MSTEAKVQLNSTELGTLWMTYMTKASRLSMCGLFKDKTIEKEAQSILTDYIAETQTIKNEIVSIFNNANIDIPLGFDERDVIKEAPPLFDDIFNIMFLRQMTKLDFGYVGVFTSMTYMKEVVDLFKHKSDVCHKYYEMTTNYLLGKGALAKPPYVTMPKHVGFIEDKNYMSGFNILSEKRSLNTIEVGYITEAIEYNIFNMQLLIGFAQVAADSEVKKYFIEGKELAKKIITELSSMLLNCDIQAPSTWAGKATDSTMAPFSDKLMMYVNSLISSTALGFTALDTSFSMRSDLPIKLALISKDTFGYAKKGAKIMISHKWMEEPPQMKDTNYIAK